MKEKEPAPESRLKEAIEQARSASGTLLETLLYHRSREVLEALLENPALGEPHLALLLSRKDLPREVIVRIAQNKSWMASYSLRKWMVRNPRTPRHLALAQMRFLYLFDLMGMVTTPGVPADLKRVAEDAILSQAEGIALGQRLTLARCGSQRIAAGLLADQDPRVIEAALVNPFLTDQSVAAALLVERAPAGLTEAVLEHPRWRNRRPVRLALIRNRHLTLGRFMGILPELTAGDLADLGSDPRVAPNIRVYVAKLAKVRSVHLREKRV